MGGTLERRANIEWRRLVEASELLTEQLVPVRRISTIFNQLILTTCVKYMAEYADSLEWTRGWHALAR